MIKEELLEEEDVNNILWEIGEEYKHIRYHIEDSGFYDYLKPLKD